MPIPSDSEIYSRVEAFAAEIVAVVRASVMDAVEQALGENARPRFERRAGTGRPRASTLGRRKGAKRDPDDIAALMAKLATFIQQNPGKRIEEIGKALGTTTKELALPVKKLVAARSIYTKGQKRATQYFAR